VKPVLRYTDKITHTDSHFHPQLVGENMQDAYVNPRGRPKRT